MDKEYEVERIIGRRISLTRGTEYLIFWAGYGAEDCTWEKAGPNLNCQLAIREFEKRCEVLRKRQKRRVSSGDGHNHIPSVDRYENEGIVSIIDEALDAFAEEEPIFEDSDSESSSTPMSRSSRSSRSSRTVRATHGWHRHAHQPSEHKIKKVHGRITDPGMSTFYLVSWDDSVVTWEAPPAFDDCIGLLAANETQRSAYDRKKLRLALQAERAGGNAAPSTPALPPRSLTKLERITSNRKRSIPVASVASVARDDSDSESIASIASISSDASGDSATPLADMYRLSKGSSDEDTPLAQLWRPKPYSSDIDIGSLATSMLLRPSGSGPSEPRQLSSSIAVQNQKLNQAEDLNIALGSESGVHQPVGASVNHSSSSSAAPISVQPKMNGAATLSGAAEAYAGAEGFTGRSNQGDEDRVLVSGTVPVPMPNSAEQVSEDEDGEILTDSIATMAVADSTASSGQIQDQGQQQQQAEGAASAKTRHARVRASNVNAACAFCSKPVLLEDKSANNCMCRVCCMCYHFDCFYNVGRLNGFLTTNPTNLKDSKHWVCSFCFKSKNATARRVISWKVSPVNSTGGDADGVQITKENLHDTLLLVEWDSSHTTPSSWVPYKWLSMNCGRASIPYVRDKILSGKMRYVDKVQSTPEVEERQEEPAEICRKPAFVVGGLWNSKTKTRKLEALALRSRLPLTSSERQLFTTAKLLKVIWDDYRVDDIGWVSMPDPKNDIQEYKRYAALYKQYTCRAGLDLHAWNRSVPTPDMALSGAIKPLDSRSATMSHPSLQPEDISDINMLLNHWARSASCVYDGMPLLRRAIPVIAFLEAACSTKLPAESYAYRTPAAVGIYPFLLVVPNSDIRTWIDLFRENSGDLVIGYLFGDEADLKAQLDLLVLHSFVSTAGKRALKCHVVLVAEDALEESLVRSALDSRDIFWQSIIVDSSCLQGAQAKCDTFISKLFSRQRVVVGASPLPSSPQPLYKLAHLLRPTQFRKPADLQREIETSGTSGPAGIQQFARSLLLRPKKPDAAVASSLAPSTPGTNSPALSSASVSTSSTTESGISSAAEKAVEKIAMGHEPESGSAVVSALSGALTHSDAMHASTPSTALSTPKSATNSDTEAAKAAPECAAPSTHSSIAFDLTIPVHITKEQRMLYRATLLKNIPFLQRAAQILRGNDSSATKQLLKPSFPGRLDKGVVWHKTDASFVTKRSPVLAAHSVVDLLVEMQSIVSHPYLVKGVEPAVKSKETRDRFLVQASAKLRLVDVLLTQLVQKHRIVLFVQYKGTADIVCEYLKIRSMEFTYLDGDLSRSALHEQAEAFNSRRSPLAVVVAPSIQNTSEGCLIAADTVIFYDCNVDPSIDARALKWVAEAGQQKPVCIFRLVAANTVDEQLVRSNLTKAQSAPEPAALEQMEVDGRSVDGSQQPVSVDRALGVVSAICRDINYVSAAEYVDDVSDSAYAQDRIQRIIDCCSQAIKHKVQASKQSPQSTTPVSARCEYWILDADDVPTDLATGCPMENSNCDERQSSRSSQRDVEMGAVPPRNAEAAPAADGQAKAQSDGQQSKKRKVEDVDGSDAGGRDTGVFTSISETEDSFLVAPEAVAGDVDNGAHHKHRKSAHTLQETDSATWEQAGSAAAASPSAASDGAQRDAAPSSGLLVEQPRMSKIAVDATELLLVAELFIHSLDEAVDKYMQLRDSKMTAEDRDRIKVLFNAMFNSGTRSDGNQSETESPILFFPMLTNLKLAPDGAPLPAQPHFFDYCPACMVTSHGSGYCRYICDPQIIQGVRQLTAISSHKQHLYYRNLLRWYAIQYMWFYLGSSRGAAVNQANEGRFPGFAVDAQPFVQTARQRAAQLRQDKDVAGALSNQRSPPAAARSTIMPAPAPTTQQTVAAPAPAGATTREQQARQTAQTPTNGENNPAVRAVLQAAQTPVLGEAGSDTSSSTVSQTLALALTNKAQLTRFFGSLASHGYEFADESVTDDIAELSASLARLQDIMQTLVKSARGLIQFSCSSLSSAASGNTAEGAQMRQLKRLMHGIEQVSVKTASTKKRLNDLKAAPKSSQPRLGVSVPASVDSNGSGSAPVPQSGAPALAATRPTTCRPPLSAAATQPASTSESPTTNARGSISNGSAPAAQSSALAAVEDTLAPSTLQIKNMKVLARLKKFKTLCLLVESMDLEATGLSQDDLEKQLRQLSSSFKVAIRFISVLLSQMHTVSDDLKSMLSELSFISAVHQQGDTVPSTRVMTRIVIQIIDKLTEELTKPQAAGVPLPPTSAIHVPLTPPLAASATTTEAPAVSTVAPSIEPETAGDAGLLDESPGPIQGSVSVGDESLAQPMAAQSGVPGTQAEAASTQTQIGSGGTRLVHSTRPHPAPTSIATTIPWPFGSKTTGVPAHSSPALIMPVSDPVASSVSASIAQTHQANQYQQQAQSLQRFNLMQLQMQQNLQQAAQSNHLGLNMNMSVAGASANLANYQSQNTLGKQQTMVQQAQLLQASAPSHQVYQQLQQQQPFVDMSQIYGMSQQPANIATARPTGTGAISSGVSAPQVAVSMDMKCPLCNSVGHIPSGCEHRRDIGVLTRRRVQVESDLTLPAVMRDMSLTVIDNYLEQAYASRARWQ